VTLRPEQIHVGGSGVAGVVQHIAFHGDHHLASVRVGDLALPVRLSGEAHPQIGSRVHVAVRGSGVAFAPDSLPPRAGRGLATRP
jgi:hypothetical protein